MKTLAFLLALIACPLYAATPITCSAFQSSLNASGYNLAYFGFTGNPTNIFTIAGSPNGINWTNVGGTWPTCGNGTPCKVNAPSVLEYTDSSTNQCHIYLLLAEANDAALNSTFQDIGVLNTDLSVTTLLTFNWSPLGASPGTIFAGNWKQVPGSTNCFDTPVSSISGYYNFSLYTACASLTPTSVSITSGPTLMSTSGTPSGNGGYDPQVIQQPGSSSCVLVETETPTGGFSPVSAILTGACPSGPFTWQFNANSTYSPVAPEISVPHTNGFEGPNYLQLVRGGWYFYVESVIGGGMYYANCTPIDLTLCKLPVPVKWIADQAYRHGTIINISPTPLPSTTVQGATVKGGTWQ